MPARRFPLVAPFTVCFAERGLDPAAAARGLAALQTPGNGVCRGGIYPSRDVCGSLRGVEDAAPYNLVILFTKTLLTDCPIFLYNRFIRYTICRIARRCYKVFATHGQEREREAVTMSDYAAIEKEARIFTEECVTNNRIDPTLFAQYDIKRGLRDKNGKGVLAGITNISRIDAFEERDGQKVPCEGKLWYRGYNVYDLIRGLRGKRYAFEGAAYLLLLGDLPNKEQLESFTACLAKCRDLPTNFVRDVIMKAPSHDLMNSLTRSVLTLANYDDDIGKTDLQTQLEQCIKLISVFPMLAVYGYHAYNYYECGGSMYIHRPDPSLSTAENLLKMLRPDQKYTDLEAHVLDIALLLHMEHGAATTRPSRPASSPRPGRTPTPSLRRRFPA